MTSQGTLSCGLSGLAALRNVQLPVGLGVLGSRSGKGETAAHLGVLHSPRLAPTFDPTPSRARVRFLRDLFGFIGSLAHDVIRLSSLHDLLDI
jgi:hypothetical protein